MSGGASRRARLSASPRGEGFRRLLTATVARRIVLDGEPNPCSGNSGDKRVQTFAYKEIGPVAKTNHGVPWPA